MISGISSSTSSWAMKRPDPSQMVSNLFSKLDTDNQGYLEKSDLISALSETSSSSDSSSISSSVDEIFSQLDSDSDGKLTEEEMTSSLQQLAEQLDAGFNNMRTTGMEGAMPPPPPPEEDTGYTAEELTTMASEVASSDANLSALMSSIASDFDTADADGNGLVTTAEAQAYQDSQTVASTSDSSSTSSSSSSTSSEAAVLKRIMQLMDSYGSFAQDSTLYGLSNLSSLSISA